MHWAWLLYKLHISNGEIEVSPDSRQVFLYQANYPTWSQTNSITLAETRQFEFFYPFCYNNFNSFKQFHKIRYLTKQKCESVPP